MASTFKRQQPFVGEPFGKDAPLRSDPPFTGKGDTTPWPTGIGSGAGQRLKFGFQKDTDGHEDGSNFGE